MCESFVSWPKIILIGMMKNQNTSILAQNSLDNSNIFLNIIEADM